MITYEDLIDIPDKRLRKETAREERPVLYSVWESAHHLRGYFGGPVEPGDMLEGEVDCYQCGFRWHARRPKCFRGVACPACGTLGGHTDEDRKALGPEKRPFTEEPEKSDSHGEVGVLVDRRNMHEARVERGAEALFAAIAVNHPEARSGRTFSLMEIDIKRAGLSPAHAEAATQRLIERNVLERDVEMEDRLRPAKGLGGHDFGLALRLTPTGRLRARNAGPREPS